MDLTITQHGDVVVAALKGRIDAFYAPELREKMESFISQGFKQFVLDLTEVQFLDSAGLAALVSVLKRSQQEGGGVKMIMPRLEAAQRILKLTRFDKVFEIVDNSDLALKSF